MKMRISLCLLLAYCFLNIQAQFSIDSFNIATYARPDLERQIAFIDPFFSFSSGVSNTNVEDHLRFRLSGTYEKTKFINTTEHQIFSSTRVLLDYRFNRNKSNFSSGQSISSNWISGSSLSNRKSKKTFKANQKFREIDYSSLLFYDFSFLKSQPSNDKKINLRSLGLLSVGFLFGKGRIEVVNDAWHAITILEFLEKETLLKEEVSSLEIRSFAERISEIKNFRNTDSRLETISEYEALTEHLIENDLIDQDNYRAFAVLFDAWRFESFTNRLSGKEFKYGLEPGLQLQHSGRSFENRTTWLNSTLAGIVSHNHYRPIKNDWQVNRKSNLEFGVTKATNLERLNEPALKRVNTFARITSNWELQYLPNQRTNYTLFFNLDYGWNQLRGKISDGFSAALAGFYNFYLNPQLAWVIRANLSLYTSDAEVFYYSNQNELSMSLSYRFQ